jgi:glutathione peroxidase-family protein
VGVLAVDLDLGKQRKSYTIRIVAEFSDLGVWLKKQKGGLLGDSIKWNFTKFLIDRAGIVRARFAPPTKPENLARKVEELL